MLAFHMGIHAWISPGSSLVISCLLYGNSISDLILKSENYMPGTVHLCAGRMSLQHMLSLKFAESMADLLLVFAKAIILNLAM